MAIKVISRREPPKPVWYRVFCPMCKSVLAFTEEEVYTPEFVSTRLLDCPVCGRPIHMPRKDLWEILIGEPKND